MARLGAGPHAGCPEALAAATLGGVLEHAVDGWDHPVQIRCYGDTLVLRSDAYDPADPFDDVVLVAPMLAQTSREVSLAEGLRELRAEMPCGAVAGWAGCLAPE